MNVLDYIWLGPDSFDFAGATVSKSMFGADMLRFRKTDGFEAAALDLGASHVRWPGGQIVDPNPRGELNPDKNRWVKSFDSNGRIAEHVFDLKNPNIIDTDGWPREGLSEAFSYAATNGLGFTIVMPTDRYVEITQQIDGSWRFDILSSNLDQDIDIFLSRLASGYFGNVPHALNLQLGQEYYTGHLQYLVDLHGLPHVDRMIALGQLYNEMASKITQKMQDLTEAGQNTQHVEPTVTVQLGRIFGNPTDSNAISGSYEDAAILASQFDAEGLGSVDNLLVQRYVTTMDVAGRGFSEDVYGNSLGSIEEVWIERAEALGLSGKDFGIFAGWAKSSLTRSEAREAFDGDVTQDEFKNRTSYEFELHYQNMLEHQHDYGPKHGSAVLQLFTELVDAGVDAATYYGVDLAHPGNLAAENVDGDTVVFLAGTVFQQLAKFTTGMYVLEGFEANSRDNFDANGKPKLNYNIFYDDQEVVAFISVNDLENDQLNVSLDIGLDNGFQSNFQAVSAVSLRAATLLDWRGQFGVENLDEVWGDGFQSAEEALYTIAEVDQSGNLPDVPISVEGSTLNFEFSQDYEIIRMVLLRTSLGSGPVLFEGGAGPDSIEGGLGSDIFIGGPGSDLIVGSGGDDVIIGDNAIMDSAMMDLIKFEFEPDLIF